jgi:DNA uptake protein ComE-like DNA-binding protein
MWIIWSFLPMFGWVTWIHARYSTQKPIYYLYALLYALPVSLMLITSNGTAPLAVQIYHITDKISMYSWLVCPLHALILRKKINLEIKYARLAEKQNVVSNLEQKIAAEYKVNAVDVSPKTVRSAAPLSNTKNPELVSQLLGETPSVTATSPSQAAAQTTPPASTPLIDLNTADESSLAALPGVGLILAKKAISARGERGGFRGFEEFCDALGLQPHLREKLRSLVIIRAPAASPPAQQPPERSGRVVDF